MQGRGMQEGTKKGRCMQEHKVRKGEAEGQNQRERGAH